jgi:hypothetical protein
LVAPTTLISGTATRPAAVVELALVEQRQQGVEDGRVGLEHLVQESHLRRGQEAVGETFVAVVLQRPERQRAEQLLRHGKARQQPLEIARAGKHAVQRRASSLLAVPGGPISSTCSPASAPSSSTRTAASR